MVNDQLSKKRPSAPLIDHWSLTIDHSHTGRHFGIAFLTVIVVLLMAATPSRAASLNSRLPPTTLSFLELTPPTAAPTDNSWLNLGLDAMTDLGLMHGNAGAIASGAKLAGIITQRPFCAALLTASFDMDYQTGELAFHTPQFALIINVQKHPETVLPALNDLLNYLTTPETARQQLATLGPTQYVTFTDTRWSPDSQLAWTMQDDALVITWGRGAMEHYLSAAPADRAPWQATLQHQDANRPANTQVTLRWFANIKTFRDRWPDVAAMSDVSRVLTILEASAADTLCFALRQTDRIVRIDYVTTTGDTQQRWPWTTDLAPNDPLLTLVPPQATAYAVLELPWPTVVAKIDEFVSVLDGQPLVRTTHLPAYGDALTHSAIIDLAADLAPRVLVHNAPPHPWHLPLMISLVAAARPGNEKATGDLLNRLFAQATRVLARRGKPGDIAPQIKPNPTGGNYLQFGLVGPAWDYQSPTFLGSWSPAALDDIRKIVQSANPQSSWFMPESAKN
jgi:hypothetical protein